MNAMERDIHNLLDTIERLKRQHRAGITPAFGELDALFEDAAIVRKDLAAVACGLTPPADRPVRPGRLVFERIDGGPLRLTVPMGQAARAVLEGLPAAASR